MNQQFLKPQEVAALLRLNERHVRRLANKGIIPGFRVSGSWRFRTSDIHKWADGKVKAIQEKPLVLAVDDDPNACALIKGSLEDEFRVAEAHGGKAALDFLKKNDVDLVFLDLRMPDMPGHEVLNEIKTEWPDLQVVVLTAYSESELMKLALRSSPFTVLHKPTTPFKILETARATAVRV